MATLSPHLVMRASATAQVAAAIRQRVRNGGLAVGDSLPAERKLAETIGVARNTIRAALQQLESEGLIVQDGYRRRIASIPEPATGVLSGTIGVVAARRDTDVSHRAPGWESFVEVGAMEEARQQHMSTLMLHAEALERPAPVEELLAHPLRGIIICSGAYRSPGIMGLIDRFRDAGLPVVVEGDPVGTESFDRVISDHTQGAAMLTRLMLERGRNRIVYLLPRNEANRYWVERRLAGYRAAMQEAGHEPLEPILTGRMAENTSDPEQFEIATMQMLGYLVDHRQRYGALDALLTASDAQVCIAAAALRKLGLEPQKDVLIAGYDNFWQELPERAFEDTAPVATVDKDNVAIGRRLVSLLLTQPRATGEPPRVEVVSPRLILPASVVAGS